VIVMMLYTVMIYSVTQEVKFLVLYSLVKTQRKEFKGLQKAVCRIPRCS